jgi:oligo-1,6-glucosidase
MISKVPDLPNVTGGTGGYQFGGKYFIHGPRLLDFLQEMKAAVLSRNDVITVGEMPTVSTEQAVRITHNETGYLSMVFHFDHMDLDTDPRGASKWDIVPWKLADLKRVMSRWQKDLEKTGWNSLYLSNHDQPRALSRFGDDGQYRVQSAKLLATFLHMLRGTPYIYQGEEIGMTNVKFESISDYRDIETLNIFRELTEVKRSPVSVAMKKIHAKSRDNARTPMQWDTSANAGFTGGKPWIGVNPNYQQINVQQAMADPDSIFAYYQRLIRLRKQSPVIVHGNYELILEAHPDIYAFTRTWREEQLIVLLNFTKNTPTFQLPDHVSLKGTELLIGNYAVGQADENLSHILRPYEARVYRRIAN